MQIRSNPWIWQHEIYGVSFALTAPERIWAKARELQLVVPDSLGGAVAKRQLEFLAGRCAASLALVQAGSVTRQVGIHGDRSPLWPQGFIGSITHCEGFAAAAVARAGAVRGLGLDSEVIMASDVAQSIQDAIASHPERKLLAAMGDKQDFALLCTLLFSAKESIYKCLYPTAQKFFDFLAVAITAIDLEAQSFQFTLREDLHEALPQGFSGQGLFHIEKEYVHTAFVWT